MDSIQLSTLAALAGKWQAEADSGAGSADRRAALRECADTVRMLCEVRFEDCPHAAPHRYCAECAVSPCPIGLGEHSVEKPAKCDGDHGGPRCADPECWNDGPIALILDELRRAVTKFPTWPTDPLHALAVLGEEFGELTKATLQTTYEPHKSSHDDVRTEAIQTAAMALRFVISLERYEYTQGIQHQQEGQPA